jgi:hypothetical protein
MSPKTMRYETPKEWENGDPPASWVEGRTYIDRKPLPAFSGGQQTKDSDRLQILFTVYKEVCSDWRTLTDVRFKLLGFVPVVSLTAIIALLSRGRDESKALI